MLQDILTVKLFVYGRVGFANPAFLNIAFQLQILAKQNLYIILQNKISYMLNISVKEFTTDNLECCYS